MPEKVLELFETISVSPDEIIIMMLFNACAKLANPQSIKIGTDVLSRLPPAFLQHQNLVNTAIDMLMKFAHIKQAEHLFASTKRNVVTYGAMMQGYINNSQPEKALDLFDEISSKADDVLYTIVFTACGSLSNERATQLGNKLLHRIPVTFRDNIVVIGSILNMLMRFGQVSDAEYLFVRMKRRTIYIYGVMMNGYNINDKPDECLKLFERMTKENLTPNAAISFALIDTCSQIGLRSICANTLGRIPLHLQGHPRMNNALIDMWVCR